jgi:hypothetical protein
MREEARGGGGRRGRGDLPRVCHGYRWDFKGITKGFRRDFKGIWSGILPAPPRACLSACSRQHILLAPCSRPARARTIALLALRARACSRLTERLLAPDGALAGAPAGAPCPRLTSLCLQAGFVPTGRSGCLGMSGLPVHS